MSGGPRTVKKLHNLYLVRQKRDHLQHPVTPLRVGHAHSPPTLDTDWSEWVIDRQCHHKLHGDLLDNVHGNDLACGWTNLDLERSQNGSMIEAQEMKV